MSVVRARPSGRPKDVPKDVHAHVAAVEFERGDIPGLSRRRSDHRRRRELARGVIAEVREVAGVAVRRARSHVRRPVPLHELHVRERAMRVDVDLLPGGGRRPGVVCIVVCHHVAAAGHIEEDGLVHEADDVVLDEVIRRAAADHDAVAVGAEAVVRRMVKDTVPHDTPIRAREGDMHARVRAIGLHVLYPAVGSVRDVDPSRHRAVVARVRPALDAQSLNARPSR